MLITVNGLVVRSYPSGNSDRIVHMLTEDRGRVSVVVKGALSNRKGSVASCTQLFTYGNFELYYRNDMYWYRGGSVLTPFYELSSDVAAVALAAYLCDIAADITPEETEEANSAMLLKDLLNSLYVLSKHMRSLTMVKAVFEMRVATLMGFRPNLSRCVLCGCHDPENAYLDVVNGRIICADCQTERNRVRNTGNREDELRGQSVICPVSSSVLAAMRYVSKADPKKIFSFSMKDIEEERSLERVTETYLHNKLERDYDTLRFYRSVTN